MKLRKKKTCQIAFVGNVNNNYFNLLSSLNELSQFNLVLIVNQKDPIVNRPKIEKLQKNFEIKKIRSRRNIVIKLIPFLSPLCIKLKKYEIVFLSAEFIALAPYLNAKTIFYPTGADLTQAPFPEMYDHYDHFSYIKKIAARKYSRNVIKGIRSVNLIATYPFAPFSLAIEKIFESNENKLSQTYLPLAIDPEFEWRIQTTESPTINYKSAQYNILIASRIIDQPTKSRVIKGSWKNISEFICGLQLFLNRNPQYRNPQMLKLTLISRENSPDFDEIRGLIESFNMINLTEILFPTDKNGFSREDFSKVMESHDLIVDDFGIGWFGSLMIETLLKGKCFIGFADINSLPTIYQNIPIHNASNCVEIAQELTKHFSSKCYNLNARNWIIDNFSGPNLTEYFMNLIREVID